MALCITAPYDGELTVGEAGDEDRAGAEDEEDGLEGDHVDV